MDSNKDGLVSFGEYIAGKYDVTPEELEKLRRELSTKTGISHQQDKALIQVS